MLTEPLYKFNKTEERVIEFKGFNARGDIDSGEMREMMNLSADEYPSLYQRQRRGVYEKAPDLTDGEYPCSLLVKSHFNGSLEKKLAVIDNNGHFYYDGVDYYDSAKLNLSKNTQMVAINDKICFFPEKKYFKLKLTDTETDEDRIGNIDADTTITEGLSIHVGGNTTLNFVASTLTFPSDMDFGSKFNVGDAVTVNFNNLATYVWSYYQEYNHEPRYGFIYYGRMAYDPDNVGAGVIFKDDIYVLPVESDGDEEGYDAYVNEVLDAIKSSSAFATAKTRYGFQATGLKDVIASTKYSRAEGITLYNGAGNRVFITGTTTSGYVGQLENIELSGRLYYDGSTYTENAIVNVSAVIMAMDGRSITFPDNTFQDPNGNQITDKNISVRSIVITRPCPDLDFVMESNNRLWGCSNKDNTIYASKLGDPTNWQYYQTTSLDSFAAEQGSDGEWTGVGAYNSHLLFFKEDCIHKVYGSYPAEYQIATVNCNGIEKGSHKSVAYLNGRLMYKSRIGIMAYDGGLPGLMSINFGRTKYKNAVAGTDGDKYYVCLEQTDGEHVLMVYDANYELWHKQDNVDLTDLVYLDGHVLFSCKADPKVYVVDADEPINEEIEWVAEFGPYDEYLENKKVYSKMKLRYKMPRGSSFKVLVSIDEGKWHVVDHISESDDRVQEIHITPTRCDCFGIRLEGKGYCKIKSLVRELRQSTAKREV